jgi:hypothetical protein
VNGWQNKKLRICGVFYCLADQRFEKLHEIVAGKPDKYKGTQTAQQS